MVADDHVYTHETCSKHYSCTSHVELPNGLNVEYARHGEASAPEKVLLIMGLHFEKESWLPIIATLLDDPTTYDPSRYELVSFDNRGVGGSDKPWELYSTSQMAQDALLLLDELKWSKAHIVGISMGGMISQELALLAPERVQSLTLMVTAPGFLRGPLPRLHQVAGYLHAGKNLLLPTRKSITNLLMFTLYPNEYLDQPTHSGKVGTMLQSFHNHRLKYARNQISGVIGQAAALMRHDVSPSRLRQIQQAGFPILIVAAKLDRLLHSDNSKYLYKHLKGPLTHKVIFEDTGHAVHVQQRKNVVAAMVQHFDRNPMDPNYLSDE